MEQSLGRGNSSRREERPRGPRVALWATAVVFASLALGCGGRTDQAPTCSPLTGCGGDLVGTWDVTSLCIRVQDGAEVPSAYPECEPVGRHALDVAVIVPKDLTATFSKDTYFRSGTATLDTSYVFTDACLAVKSYDVASAETCDQVGLELQSGSSLSGLNLTPTVVTCRLDSASCVCQLSGDVSINDSGSYRVSGSEIFFDGQATGGTYCSRNGRALISTNSTSTTTRMGLKRH
jgi:hypothetical protein